MCSAINAEDPEKQDLDLIVPTAEVVPVSPAVLPAMVLAKKALG